MQSVRYDGAVLHCTKCSASPYHRACAGEAWASTCPQCMRGDSVARWCRADAGPSLEPIATRLDRDGTDLSVEVHCSAPTAAPDTSSVGVVDDDEFDTIEAVRLLHGTTQVRITRRAHTPACLQTPGLGVKESPSRGDTASRNTGSPGGGYCTRRQTVDTRYKAGVPSPASAANR